MLANLWIRLLDSVQHMSTFATTFQSLALGVLLTFGWTFQLSPQLGSVQTKQSELSNETVLHNRTIKQHLNAAGTHHIKVKKSCDKSCHGQKHNYKPRRPPKPQPQPIPLPQPIPVPEPLPEPKPLPLPLPCSCSAGKLCPQSQQSTWNCTPEPLPLPGPCGCPPNRYCIMEKTTVICPIYETS